MGFLYNDFQFTPPVPPKPRLPLSPKIFRVFPIIPLAGLNPNPPQEPFQPGQLSQVLHRMDIFTYGYGFIWQIIQKFELIAGVPLTIAQAKAIRDFTISRIVTFEAAYDFHHPNLPYTQSPIYPLLETTEKTHVSYLMGSMMCQTAGGEAVKQRLGIHVGRLFHTKLLETKANFANAIVIVAARKGRPDFVAIDSNHNLHLFEAKGTGNEFEAEPVWVGLQQVLNIFTLNGCLPYSRNVCYSYVQPWQPNQAPLVVNQMPAIHTSVFHIPARTETVKQRQIESMQKIRAVLTGRYALALYYQIQAFSEIEILGDVETGWARVEISEIGVIFFVSGRFIGVIRSASTEAKLNAVVGRTEFPNYLDEACFRIGQEILLIDQEERKLPLEFHSAIFVEGNWLAVMSSEQGIAD